MILGRRQTLTFADSSDLKLNFSHQGILKLGSEQLAYSTGLGWRVNIPEELPMVMGDVDRLQQVVFNLVNEKVADRAAQF